MKTRITVYALAVVMGLLSAFTVAFGQVLASQFKTMKLGPYSVGVVCLTGDKPVVNNSGSLVIVSCPIK